jgi:hypothetical protein
MTTPARADQGVHPLQPAFGTRASIGKIIQKAATC